MQYADEKGIIDLAYVQERIEMEKRKELLAQHKYQIWYSQNENVWYTHLPDDTKKSSRKKVKRKHKEDLEKVVCEYYDNLNNVSAHEPITLEDLFYEFMKYKKKLVSTGTIKRMMADWKKFYMPHKEFVHTPFGKITKIQVDEFFNGTVEQYQLNDKAFRNMCGVLKQIFEYAVESEYIEKSPYRVKVNRKKIVKSRRKTSETEIFRVDEQVKLIAEMERRLLNNPANTAILGVMLLFEIGVRKGELLAINASDITDGCVHICRQVVEEFDITDLGNIKSKRFKIVDYTKSEEGDRYIPLTENAKDIIYRIQEINQKYNQNYHDYLFVSNGYVMSPDAIDTQLKRGCEYIGMRVKTAHKIRKTFASRLIESGVPLVVVKELMGHASEQITLKHYCFNLYDEDKTKGMVLQALQNGCVKSTVRATEDIQDVFAKLDLEENGNTLPEFEREKVTTGDQKIVSLANYKKTRNPA